MRSFIYLFIFQLSYGTGFYNGIGPPFNGNNNNPAYRPPPMSWISRTSNASRAFDNIVPLNPYLGRQKQRFEFKREQFRSFLVFKQILIIMIPINKVKLMLLHKVIEM